VLKETGAKEDDQRPHGHMLSKRSQLLMKMVSLLSLTKEKALVIILSTTIATEVTEVA
jgi:hypothetical protein